MTEPLTSNLKLCADLRTVAEQLDRPDGWGRAALSVRGAIEAIERLERERDTAREALRISELRVREHWPERDRLRAALEQSRDKHSRRHPQCLSCYEALRGAVPAEEPALHKVDSVSPALRNAVETSPVRVNCQHLYVKYFGTPYATCTHCGASVQPDKTTSVTSVRK